MLAVQVRGRLTVISQYANHLIVVGSDAYKALADPTRRQILKLLRDDDLPAGVIAEQFDITWPSVSRHLAVLTSAGLVRATRRGQQLVYSLTTSVLMDIATELADMARINEPRTEANRTPARTTARVRPNPRRAPS
jgi:ArsR family transcriptional regulator